MLQKHRFIPLVSKLIPAKVGKLATPFDGKLSRVFNCVVEAYEWGVQTRATISLKLRCQSSLLLRGLILWCVYLSAATCRHTADCRQVPTVNLLKR